MTPAKNLKREEALMSGGCVALAHKQHLIKTPFLYVKYFYPFLQPFAPSKAQTSRTKAYHGETYPGYGRMISCHYKSAYNLSAATPGWIRIIKPYFNHKSPVFTSKITETFHYYICLTFLYLNAILFDKKRGNLYN
jgi:hypothetical protein